jgi:Asp-tRNA(Asn)/Glu-tRNA(Gln) amidotransferase A subunit family amidase
MASMELDLCYLTATEAIDQFKARKLSPVELMKALLARCEAVNPKLNVLTYIFPERALEQAKAAETRYMKGNTRPLEGVPVAIKDFHPVKGEITTFGSLVYKDFRPDNTAPTIERLFDAGAIMHCRTTTPEFAHSGVTKSLLWGTSRNPWNLEYSPGGSSGGAGAALAAGMTTIETAPTAAAPSGYLPQSTESLATSRLSGATRWIASILARPSCIMVR